MVKSKAPKLLASSISSCAPMPATTAAPPRTTLRTLRLRREHLAIPRMGGRGGAHPPRHSGVMAVTERTSMTRLTSQQSEWRLRAERTGRPGR